MDQTNLFAEVYIYIYEFKLEQTIAQVRILFPRLHAIFRAIQKKFINMNHCF